MTTQEKLDEAEAAYHALMTGTQARVFVDQNGERVEFNSANIKQLYAYIQDLKGQISPIVRPPLGFFF